jgi:aminopeptidase N
MLRRSLMRNVVVPLVVFILVAAAVPAAAVQLIEGPLLPEHEINVTVEPSKHLLTGRVRVILPVEKQYTVDLGKLRLTGVALNGEMLDVTPTDGVFTVGPTAGVLVVGFEGVFPGNEIVKDEELPVVREGIIDKEGLFLTGHWYPIVQTEDHLAYYRLTVTLPDGFVPVSENDEIRPEGLPGNQTRYSFRFKNPLPALTLTAGPYSRNAGYVGNTVIYTYLFPRDAKLSDIYIEQAKKYIRFYEEVLGDYPYRHLFIVENVLPESHSMPTYALLGWDIARRPFLAEPIVARDVLSQWVGNSLYVDVHQGDWGDGLTAFLSEHLFAERKGRDAAFRKKALVTYNNYAQGGGGTSLADYKGPEDAAGRAMMQGKGVVFFHMLDRKVGRDALFQALQHLVKIRRFKMASWTDVRKSFEVASGKDLKEFFAQWVERPGVPSFTVSEPRALLLDGSYRVTFTLRQQGKPYRFSLPVVVDTEAGAHETDVEVTEPVQYVSLKTPGQPTELVVDPGYDVLRVLDEDETPPVLSAFLGSPERIVALPGDDAERKKYAALLETLRERGFTLKDETEVTDEEIRKASFMVLGHGSPVLGRLYAGDAPFREALDKAGRPRGGEAALELAVRKNPLNGRRVVASVEAAEAFQVLSSSHAFFRDDTSSVLGFRDGERVLSYTLPSQEGMRFDLSMSASAVVPGSGVSLDEAIRKVIDKPVIYVGEGHARYQDHRVQLALLKALQEEGRPFGIGMEMFERPFQDALDEYVAGNIDEQELLKKTQYYERWRYNYHLYREILSFARTHKIPVVALNQKAEVVKKVAEGGLDALGKEERSQVPEDMDFSDAGYKERLRAAFTVHDNGSFTNFYQAQILWDETMAHAVADFFRTYPGYQMVVLAGSSHVAFGSGIPRRAYRLTGKDYAILLGSPEGEHLVPGMADYVVFAQPLAAPEPEKLGVVLEKGEEGVRIKEVAADSPAAKAGLQPGDVLVSAGGLDIKEISDLRIALFDKHPGETLSLKVRREGSWGRGSEAEFTVTFP